MIRPSSQRALAILAVLSLAFSVSHAQPKKSAPAKPFPAGKKAGKKTGTNPMNHAAGMLKTPMMKNHGCQIVDRETEAESG